MRGRRVFLGMLLCSAAAAQESAEVRAIRAQLANLRSRYEQATRNVRELVRLRVSWDLAVPMAESELLRGTSAKRPSPETNVKLLLEQEAERTRRLRERLAALASGQRPKSEPEPPQRHTAPAGHAKPPSVTKRPEPQSEKAGGTALDHAPRRDPDAPSVVQAPLPVMADPFQASGRARFRLTPAPSYLKRIASLLDAGLARQALLVIDSELGADTSDPPLLFLRARAFEVAGLPEEARAAFEKVRELDTVKPAEGEQGETKVGPWAAAAELALRHATWVGQTKGVRIPDAAEIKW